MKLSRLLDVDQHLLEIDTGFDVLTHLADGRDERARWRVGDVLIVVADLDDLDACFELVSQPGDASVGVLKGIPGIPE